LDEATGWYDYGARWYDPAVARFLSVDPLADHPKLVAHPTYSYAVNNPIRHNDPDGKCPPWICGALAGAAVEAGSQYLVNLAKGDGWLEAAGNIDGADVFAATVEGALKGLTNTKHLDDLDQVQRELRKSMNGSQRQADRLSKQADLTSTIKGNATTAAASATVISKTAEEVIKSYFGGN
jgi:RHS repeat-associated protein